jgi:hypothetical protein
MANEVIGAGSRALRRRSSVTAACSAIMPLLLWLSLLSTAGGQAAQEPGPEEIVRRSVELSQKDWKRVSDYDYFERELDGSHSKTYQVRMLLGSRYRRLIAVDDKPLSPEAQAREQRLYQKTLSDREHETPEQRERRLAQHQKEISRQQPFLDQILKAFDFTLAGQETVASRRVYALKAQPRRGYRPPNPRRESSDRHGGDSMD